MHNNLNNRQRELLLKLPISWKIPLMEICMSSKIDNLLQFLEQREQAGAIIYPEKNNIFASLEAVEFDKIKVVIVGQDPYHNPGQAQGLCFSVPQSVKIPPSLRNIFKELKKNLNINEPEHGDLIGWAKQGVLLLNAILTVEDGVPAAHANKGWELFTDNIIAQLIERDRPLVIMLWGNYAQKKIQKLNLQIDNDNILILKAAHPSPLSVRGFLGCRHFSQTNIFLEKHHMLPINWADLKR